MTRKYTLLCALLALQGASGGQGVACECLKADQFEFGNKIEGIDCYGRKVDYNQGSLSSVSLGTSCVPVVSIVTAGLSILSDKWALASSIVNTGVSLVPLCGGLYEPGPNMRVIGYKIVQSTLLFGATAASILTLYNFPDQNNDSGFVINGTSNDAFYVSYVTNITLTSLATLIPCGAAIVMNCCSRSKRTGERTPLRGDNPPAPM